MASLKQYKKRRKQLKANIKAAKAHLKGLKKQLRGLREEQQHRAIDNLDELLNHKESTSFFKQVLKKFRLH